MNDTKRYYLAEVEQCDIDGAIGYRCRASAYPGLLFEGGQLFIDPATDAPKHKFALVLVDTTNHDILLADPKMHPLPVVPLGLEVAAIAKEDRDKMVVAFQKLGIDTSVVQSVNSYRKIIRALGQVNDPNFSENMFSVLK